MKKSANNLDPHNKRNSLGMNRQIYQQLLKQLDSVNPSTSDVPVKRVHTRLEYLDPYLELELQTDGRSQRDITVATRNISRGGMSVLHASFIYPETRINARLHRGDGSSHRVSGKVIRCEHRGGVVHEIGIQFDSEIIVQEFIRPDINDSIKSLEIADPQELSGKVLFVGNDPTITPLLRQYLQNTNISFGFVNTADDAIAKGIHEYRLILSCLDAGNMSGPEFAKYLRDNAYNRPIILAGCPDGDLDKQQIRLSTADMFLPVPIAEKDLMCALGEFLISEWSEKTLEAVRSGVDRNTIDSLRIELTKLGVSLEQQIATDDPVKVYATCTKIRSIAPLLGMKSLRDLTLSVGENITRTGELSEFASELDEIQRYCKSMNKAA